MWWSVVMDITRVQLPVVSAPGYDIDKAIQGFKNDPKSRGRSHLHLIRHLNRRSLFVGPLGLTGGGSSYSSPSEMSPTEPHITTTLKDLLMQDEVTNTEELIRVINDWKHEGTREALFQQTMHAFILEFSKSRLTGWLLPHLIEFASLSELKAETVDAKTTMRSHWLSELTHKATEDHGDEPFMKALNIALQTLDVEIFGRDPSPLIKLANVLMNKLNPSNIVFLQSAYHKQCDILCALHRIFQLISYVDPVQWDMTKPDTVFSKFTMAVKEIIQASSNCFVLRHHAKLVQQNIVQLGSQGFKKTIRAQSQTAWKTLKGLLFVLSGVGSILSMRFELESFERAYELINEVYVSDEKEAWFLWLRSLQTIAVYVLEDAKNLRHYKECLTCVLNKMPMLSDEDRKHLRYGMIEQLTMMILTSNAQESKEEISTILTSLISTKKGGDTLASDKDIIEFESDCLGLINGRAMLNEGVFNGSVSSSGSLSLSQSLSTSLHSIPEYTRNHLESLFAKVKSSVINHPSYEWNIQRVSSIDPLEELKDVYKEYLTTVTSPVDGRKRDVSALKFNLMEEGMMENRVSSGSIDDISSSSSRGLPSSEFKMKIELRDLFPDDEEVSRVLVKGMPGVGKSALACRLAVDWSKQKWGSQFTAVFLLSISSLCLRERDGDEVGKPSLAKEILKYCDSFMGMPSYNQELLKRIQNQLKQPTTLVILDEMQEGKGDAKRVIDAVVHQAKTGQHQLLMLSRPGIVDVDGLDRIYELCPLPKDDVLDSLPDDPKIRLKFQASPSLLEIAQNPLHLEILCHPELSSQDDLGKIPSGSEASCHRRIVTKLWQFHAETSNLPTVSRDEAFIDLGLLAIRGLKSKGCRISVDDVEVDVKYLVHKSELVNRNLLCRHRNGDVEFTHGILQQYFAGHLLAKWLFSSKDEEKEAKSWIQKVKYNVQYAPMLKVIAGVTAKDKGKDGIRKILTTISAGGVEPLGLQHLALKMNILQEWLLEDDDVADYEAVDKQFKMSKTLTSWIKKGLRDTRKKNGMSDVTALEAVVRVLKTAPNVVARAKTQWLLPHVVNELKKQEWDVEDIVIETLAVIIDVGHDNREIWMNALKEGLSHQFKIQRAVVECIGLVGKYSKKSIPLLIELLLDGDQDKIRDLKVIEMLQRSPECKKTNFDNFLRICKSKDYWVRRATAEAIPEILKDDSERASHFMTVMMEACENDPRTVSAGVIDALGICVELHSGYAKDLVKNLLNGWKFMGEDQRHAAAKAFNRVILRVPGKAVDIVWKLLEDDDEAPWPSVYPIVKTVLEVIGNIPHEEADEVVKLLKETYDRKEDNHSLALVLVAIEHVVETSDSSLPELIPIILTAFEDEDWSIRNLAYRAAGAIAEHKAMHLTDEFVKAVVERCKNETIWKAQCGVFEAASQFLEANADLQDLFTVCSDALGNADDIIRELAGNAVTKAEIERFKRDDSVINHLVDRLQSANEETEHGIIHCLKLIAQNIPEAIPMIQPVFAEATSSQSSIVASAAVSGLLTVASSEKANVEELIDPLNKACESTTRGIRFCALEALTTCIGEGKYGRKDLIASLQCIPDPLNDKEWTVYFEALKVAVREPQEETSELLKILLKDSIEDLAYVRKQRRAIIDDMPLDLLLNWYENSPMDSVAQQIFRRFYQVPCIFNNKRKVNQSNIQVYSENLTTIYQLNRDLRKELEHRLKQERRALRKNLRSYFNPILRRPWQLLER